MRISQHYRDTILMVTVHDTVTLTSDLSPLYELVRTHIAQRQTSFAFEFTPDSYFYSQHLAVILKCAERIHEAEGVLALVHPTRELAEALAVIDPESQIRLGIDDSERVPASALATA
jgi:hypothetical protein